MTSDEQYLVHRLMPSLWFVSPEFSFHCSPPVAAGDKEWAVQREVTSPEEKVCVGPEH